MGLKENIIRHTKFQSMNNLLYIPLINIEKTGKSRDWVLHALTAENIGTDVHYIPVHLHPYYADDVIEAFRKVLTSNQVKS